MAVKVNASQQQVEALEVFKELIESAAGRRAFATARTPAQKQAAYNKHKRPARLKKAKYTDIPPPVRELLEALSYSELTVLSDLDKTFVDAGLFVTTSPGGLMVH